jgi:hypothetical protein
MRRFLKEYGNITASGRSLYFIAVVFTVISMIIMMYGEGIKATVRDAYQETDGTVKEYAFQVSSDTNEDEDEEVTINSKYLKSQAAYTDFLYSIENADFVSYCLTTAETSVDNVSDYTLAVNSALKDITSEEELEELNLGKYDLNVLFVDKETAEYLGIFNLVSGLFGGAVTSDYNENVPVIMGYGWSNEGIQLGEDAMDIDVEVAGEDYTYTINAYTFLPPSSSVTIDGVTIDLDNYIIIPMLDLTNDNMPARMDTIRRWSSVCTMRNNGLGKLYSTLSANSLQKELYDMADDQELDYKLIIKDADYNSSIIYRDDLETMESNVKKVSNVFFAISILLMLVYIVVNFYGSKKYIYMAMLTGTSKFSLTLKGVVQLVFFVIAVGICSYAGNYGICKILQMSVGDISKVVSPIVILAIVCAIVHCVLYTIYDPFKAQRNSK